MASAIASSAPSSEVRRKKILLLTHGLPVGGTETLICHLARRLPRDRPADVEIGCLDQVGTLGNSLRREGTFVVCYERRPGLDLRVPLRIASHVRRRSIDLVHAHQLTSYVYGVLAKLLCGVPLVYTEHGRFHPDVSTRRRRLFNKLFSRLVDRTTAVSKNVSASLRTIEGFQAQQVEIIPNGIDVARFAAGRERRRQIRRALEIPDESVVIGTVGRLDPIKDQSLLIRALRRLLVDVPSALLLVVGDGPERARLEAATDESRVRERVRFLGMRRDVAEVLPAFDLFALSSLSEGMPMTLLEAMSACLPIVTTDVGGIPEILQHRSEAYLVPRTDSPGEMERRYAEALREVLTNEAFRASLAANAYARAQRDFSLESVVARYDSIYEEVLAYRPSSR